MKNCSKHRNILPTSPKKMTTPKKRKERKKTLPYETETEEKKCNRVANCQLSKTDQPHKKMVGNPRKYKIDFINPKTSKF